MALSAIQLQRLDASRKPVIAQSEEEEQGGLSQGQLIKLGRGDIPDPTTSPYLEAVDKASHNDPDKMIEAIALEQETNLPTEIIEEDPEEAKRQAWVKANGWDMEGDEDSPKTTEWLSDPDKATVAKDDYSNLREIEKAVRQQEAYDGMEFQDLGNIFESWLIGIPKMGHQLAYWMGQDEMKFDTSILDKKLRDDALAAGDQEMLGRLDKIDAERAELDAIAAENMADLKADIEFASERQADLAPQGDFIAEVIHGGGTMALDLAPGMLVSALTRGRINPTLPFLTSKVFADASYEALADGRSFAEANRYAAGQAGLEYVFEKIPTKQLQKIVGDLGGTGTVRGTLKRWFATEALTEQGAELTQSIHSYLSDLDEEMTNANSWGERAEIQTRRQWVTLFSTIIGGGGVSATVHGLDRLVGRKQRANREAMKKAFERTTSEQSQEGMDKLFSLAQSSKTNERDAAYLEDHINKVAPDGKIFLSADAVDAMDVVPDYISAQLDGSRSDIVIPLSRFVRDFAGDAAKLNEIRRYVKTAAHLQTLEELEGNTDSSYIKRVIDEAAKAQDTKEEADRIYDEIVQQLVATGRQSPLTSRQSAQLIPAVITTQYEELKKMGATNPDGSEITVAQLFEDMGLKILGPQDEVTSKDFTNQTLSQSDIVVGNTVTLEDGRTYEKAKTDVGHEIVLVPADLLEELWAESGKVGPGPEYTNQISNRIEQYNEFLLRHDRGTFIKEGKEIPMPQENILVGNAVVRDGFLAFGDGRHRARAQMEQGLEKIPISMDAESIANLQAIIHERGGVFPTPRVLNQQDFGGIGITETVMNEDGEIFDLTESAQSLWQAQQDRLTNLEALRECTNA